MRRDVYGLLLMLPDARAANIEDQVLAELDIDVSWKRCSYRPHDYVRPPKINPVGRRADMWMRHERMYMQKYRMRAAMRLLIKKVWRPAHWSELNNADDK